MSQDFPYSDRFPVHRTLPEAGRSHEDILEELATMAKEEDSVWEDGSCSGTIYCGDHEHYSFMEQAFGYFAHMNVLQRDMCPSATKFEGEIIAMALDLFHGADAGDEVCGSVTSGGTESIISALLAYRDHGRSVRGIDTPNMVKPETAHAAFDKGAHLFGIEVRTVPVLEDSRTVDPEVLGEQIDENTVVIVGSACNYGYGTIDPIPELSALAVERGVGLHVDGCLGGYILPWGEQLGYDIPPFDFRLDGVTTISADTHKYGYGFKGTSTLLFRSSELRRHLYSFNTDWTGGKYMSPGIAGSRSGGLLAATWASMVTMGRDGYLAKATQIFSVADQMRASVERHPELTIIGSPTFCFSFMSEDLDIYLVNDRLRELGWRLNGQQYPNAIHMAVTGPQTQPGVVERFDRDLADAVGYAREHHGEAAMSGSIYGGIPGGPTPDADEFIREVMADMLDTQQGLPPESAA